MAKTATPFDKVSIARSTLDAYVRYGEVALGEKTQHDFLIEVAEAFGYLMDFRNMVRLMSELGEAPKDAVKMFID